MKRWFLPYTPDLLGLLLGQSEITCRGIDAFVRWSAGDLEAGRDVRHLEHEADEARRKVFKELRAAFSTPLDPEDIYELSERLDEVLNGAKDTVRESDVMSMPPDFAMAQMIDLLVVGVGHLGEAFVHLGAEGEDATGAADAAVKSMRALEHVYRRAMSDLLALDDLREMMGRRELYGRLVAISEQMRAVAERVWYAVVKEA